MSKLTGKENKKERTAKSKEASELKVGKQYIDACKVLKGLEPKNGFFVLAGQAKPEAPKKKPADAPAAAAAAPEAEAKKETKGKAKKRRKRRHQPCRETGARATEKRHH